MEYGLIGEKLSHSYSKEIHALIGDYDYSIRNIKAEALPEFFRRKDFKGLNVTIPYKKTVIPYCDELSPIARRLGSVNTVLHRADGTLFGDNTDYFGFSYMAKRAGISFEGKNVLVFGSGGTGKTVEAAASDEGAKSVTIVSRRGKVNYRNVYEFDNTQVIVNATPVGMYPKTGASPADLSRFPLCEGVLDAIYNPMYPALLLQARERGIPFANGLLMLAAQAVRSAFVFFGDEFAPKNDADRIAAQLGSRFANIVLIGMPGCGKTTVGKILAELTGKTFIDTDLLIEEESGTDIPELFRLKGEEHFRNLETAAIEKTGMGKGQIIATGGGAVLRDENYGPLKQNGVIVYLKRDLSRLSTKDRPLSPDIEALKKLFESRRERYEKFCDFSADSNASPEEAAKAILKEFEKYLPGWEGAKQ
jgi:shikimate dehydrogenase